MIVASGYSLCPGGVFPKEHTHALEKGAVIQLLDGRVSKITSDGQEQIFASPEDGSGSGLLAATSEQTKPRPGWVAFGSWSPQGSESLALFRGTWKVPEPPTVDAGQVVYLAFGVKPSYEANTMLGAVLQWGSGGSGAKDSWGLKCWLQDGNTLAYRELESPKPGERIEATIERVTHNDSGSEWHCTARIEGDKDSEDSLKVIRLGGVPDFAWAYTAFEAYSSNFTRDQVPATRDTLFGGLEVQSEKSVLVPAWKPTVLFHALGTQIDILSPSEICIQFADDNQGDLS